jgi:hypothetical protein
VAPNGGHSPSSGFPNCPRSQLPVSHSSSSQWLDPNSPLTHSLTRSLTNLPTTLHFTELNWTHSKSQSYFTTGSLLPIISSWRQAHWDSRPAIFFQLNTCSHSPYVTSSLTRGWVCHLQLLLALVSTVISQVWVPRDSWPHFTDSDSRLPQPGGPGPCIYILPGTGWPSYTPRHWVPFLPPLTTRRATVEVFDSASTRATWLLLSLAAALVYRAIT